jgi:Asp-tRNA(Asn)/Glu-tRNA(Gln) amidotransferase A subunit family amidase
VRMPLDVRDELEQVQADAEAVAEAYEVMTGIDRREFVLMSIAAAAVSTLGVPNARAQGAIGGAQAAQTPAPPLGNAEPVSWTFQPYPGGTGALMEKLIRERGAKAFERSSFTVDKWTGPVPATDEDIAYLPAHRLAALVREKRITSTRLTQIYLDRLKRLNGTLLCAVTIMEQQALAEAAEADAEIRAGRYRGPLHGIPYGIKDLFATKGVPTTWGAADFESRIIDEDAEVVVRLRNAGAVLIAKLATGLYAQNDQWFRGRTNNPWNLTQGSSGSSAGPGSATAAGCVAFAIGTETQGSIVSPSIRCGVSALRPTFGRVSRAGGMVLAWSMDRVGPMCRTAEDCAMVFNAIHGADPRDPGTVTVPFQFNRNIRLAALRIGFDPGRAADGNRPAQAGAPTELVEILRSLGANLREIGPRPDQGMMAGPGLLRGGGLNAEYAAAFDELVQRKAREIGLDLNALAQADTTGRGGGGGGRGAGGGAPATPIPGSSTPNNPAAGPADWNPRFVAGRTIRAMDFLQVQRRRYAYIAAWAEFMKDLDLFVGAPQADIAPNAQTGHPCVVLPYKFDVPQGGGGGRGGGAEAAPTLNKQPICGVITGNLYNDDIILSVAHQIQTHTDFHLNRPRLG